MDLPPLTGLTPADIAEFEELLSPLQYGYAKHLSAWLNEKILAQHERNRVFEIELAELQKQADAADTSAARIDAYVDQIAESCVSPPTPETKLH